MKMPLYRLTIETIFQRKVWVIMLFCLLLFPLVLPFFTPHNVNPTLIDPARAQAAWVTLWVVSIGWGFFQAAGFGCNNANSGLGSYFLSAGVSRVSQMIQIWLACLTFVLPLVAVTLIVSLVGAMPDGDAGAWVVTNLQYTLLLVLVVSPLMMISLSLGSRFGATAGYVLPLFLVLYGMYGVGYLTMMTDVEDNVFLDTLYVLSPHYHLADLTSRLVFKQGGMLGSEFLQLVGYFVGVKLILIVLSALFFKVKPSA